MTDEEIIGRKFGQLTVLSIYRKVIGRAVKRNARIAVCECDCGEVRESEYCNLPTGNTKMCKRCSSIKKSNHKRVHGHSEGSMGRTKIEGKMYYTWCAMKRRCGNEGDKRFDDYGGRGIKVCARWADSYEAFLEDFGLPPTMKHQIDRIDNDGDYSNENCQWVTRKQNARNKRNSKIITAQGVSKTQVEWSEITGIKRETIAMRLKRGWSEERALGFKCK